MEAIVSAPASTDDDNSSVFGSGGEGSSVRWVSSYQSTAAIAAFLLAHAYDRCGEGVEVQRLGRFVGLVCESCGEQRVLEVVEEHDENGGER